MNSLGIRVEPKCVTCIVLTIHENESLSVSINETLKVPTVLDFPEKLKYLRNSILDMLREFEIKTAGIRIAEKTSYAPSIERLHIEGVIQEALASSKVISYFTGIKKTIAPKTGVRSADLEGVFTGKIDLPAVKNWKDLSNREQREAALVAFASFN